MAALERPLTQYTARTSLLSWKYGIYPWLIPQCDVQKTHIKSSNFVAHKSYRKPYIPVPSFDLFTSIPPEMTTDLYNLLEFYLISSELS
jgi:hypothetical protein